MSMYSVPLRNSMHVIMASDFREFIPRIDSVYVATIVLIIEEKRLNVFLFFNRLRLYP